MNTNELIKLIETVKAMGYGHIDITHEGTHLMLDEKSLAGTVMPGPVAAAPAATPVAAPVVSAVTQTAAPAGFSVEAAAASSADTAEAPAVDTAGTVTIDSPIVGTFYESPSPDADAFVKVGDKVKKGDVVCIIEAMKLMNEIEAECNGEIVEILVSNEAGVEYNQPLYRIKPV